MLLVDDGERQVPKLHRILDQRVGTHEDLHRSVAQARVDELALFRLRGARKQGHPRARRRQEFLHTLVMLVREYLGRRHHAGLEAVVERHHRRKHRHQRLAAAHVALQQTVHLLAAGHVGPYLLEHALLRSGERERQRFIGLVKIVADAAEHHPAVGPHPYALLTQQRQLEVKQLFEFEAPLRPLQVLDGGREMDVAQRGINGYQALFFAYPRGQRLFHRRQHAFQQRPDDLLEELVGDAGTVELFGARIDAHHHAQLGEALLRGQIHFRMYQVPAVVEGGGLAEDDVFRPDLQLLLHPLEALEEDQVDGAGAVGKTRHQPRHAALPHLVDAGDAAAQLDVRRGRIDLPHAVEAGTVHIAKGEII